MKEPTAFKKIRWKQEAAANLNSDKEENVEASDEHESTEDTISLTFNNRELNFIPLESNYGKFDSQVQLASPLHSITYYISSRFHPSTLSEWQLNCYIKNNNNNPVELKLLLKLFYINNNNNK